MMSPVVPGLLGDDTSGGMSATSEVEYGMSGLPTSRSDVPRQ